MQSHKRSIVSEELLLHTANSSFYVFQANFMSHVLLCLVLIFVKIKKYQGVKNCTLVTRSIRLNPHEFRLNQTSENLEN